MEYVQEHVTTLHDFGDARPLAPTNRTAVVVPMTEREHATPAAEGVLSTLETVDPARVVVPLRASADRVATVRDWLDSFDLPLELLWCDGARLGDLLSAHGLNGTRGKGRDVWLALGLAAESDYVVVHDADTKTYTERHVPKLLFPLAHGHEFSKGYYARVEADRLYGRLFRLLYEPLVVALAAADDAPVLDYLGAFRYALAGEFAMTGALARRMRVQRGWGLEIGTLGEAFGLAGSDAVAQVDLGVHEHDHRAVSGPSGLSAMSEQVTTALLRAVEENGGTPTYETLNERYRRIADRFIDRYGLDAEFNGLTFDAAGERAQVETYADAISPPDEDTRLPAWRAASITPDEVLDAASTDLQEAADVRIETERS